MDTLRAIANRTIIGSTMSQDEFTKLFTYMTERFDTIDAELAKKADADEMNNRFDGIVEAIDNLDTEYAAISAQLDRHDKQIHEIADHVGFALNKSA